MADKNIEIGGGDELSTRFKEEASYKRRGQTMQKMKFDLASLKLINSYIYRILKVSLSGEISYTYLHSNLSPRVFALCPFASPLLQRDL